jgi:hypothetical protein
MAYPFCLEERRPKRSQNHRLPRPRTIGCRIRILAKSCYMSSSNQWALARMHSPVLCMFHRDVSTKSSWGSVLSQPIRTFVLLVILACRRVIFSVFKLIMIYCSGVARSGAILLRSDRERPELNHTGRAISRRKRRGKMAHAPNYTLIVLPSLTDRTAASASASAIRPSSPLGAALAPVAIALMKAAISLA